MKSPAAGLSATAWNALLVRLGTDLDAAGGEYERLRGRLVRFLEWQRSAAAEDLADVVLTRLANKCDAGEPIANIHAYAMGIARFVLQEAGAHRPMASLDAEGVAPPAASAAAPDEQDAERRAACLDSCLDRLPDANRELVLRYYEGEGQARIARRRELAGSLRITERALRLRMFRLRDTLQDCVQGCVSARERVRIVRRTPPAHT